MIDLLLLLLLLLLGCCKMCVAAAASRHFRAETTDAVMCMPVGATHTQTQTRSLRSKSQKLVGVLASSCNTRRRNLIALLV